MYIDSTTTDKEKFKDLIIYTGIYYQKDATYDARSQIWPQTIANAEKLGIPIVIRNDGGVPDELLNQIKSFKNVTIVDKNPEVANTLGSGRREALQKCIEIAKENGIEDPVFLWTEPEKDDLITPENLTRMVRVIRDGAHIAVAEREEKAWQQLPKTQKWFEKRANKRAHEVANPKPDKELDMWFAPKMFDTKGSQYFLKYNSDKTRLDLWDSLMVPVMDAVKDGVEVKGVPVDFLYNEAQIKVESDESNKEIKIKRLEQYSQILKELGDPKWIEFFETSKEELQTVKEIKKEDKLLVGEEAEESKKGVMNQFWKLK